MEHQPAGVNTACGVNAVSDHKDKCRNDLQGFGPGEKAVGEELGNGDGISGKDGKTTQFGRDQEPCGDGSRQQPDGDPELTHAEQINGAGEPHQHPCTHIGSPGGKGGNPCIHAATTEEIFFFSGIIFQTFAEKINSDTDNGEKINTNGPKSFPLHTVNSCFKVKKIALI